MSRLVVLDVVGLTPRLLAHMPKLRALAERGFQAPLGTVLPAVTCSVQSTFLTGAMPSDHGIVGNGWYFRELGEVFLWRQHNALVGGEKLWDAARKVRPDYTVANVCWWYAMGAQVDWTITPRPIYRADGRKEPDCYTYPPELHDELPPFPLFTYWGPGAGMPSSQWIVNAALHLLKTRNPDLTLVYVPHLDYDLQRFGPSSPQAAAAAAALDEVLAPLLSLPDTTVVALSEYGITDVSRPVDINRMLRSEGLLEVYTQDGMEYLDPWVSRAFAVADHQVAHVYVRDPAEIPAVAKLCAAVPGVDLVLDDAGKTSYGLDHFRAGDLVLVASDDSWFTYYYWLDDARAPDFARCVEIHRKPGYDPAELFFDPADPGAAKRRAITAVARKKLGLRYLMNPVGLDAGARAVKGSHGRLPASPEDAPVLLCSEPSASRENVSATDVKALLLGLAGLS
ncbi:alkaline phosphatase family protein [Actinoplanes sp. LDG1-06]|uniref:Alkaline phosphatase family protein n=1 Tax=Paractinoplanes ovalisporus TaxID=2810368 RepID=A0ABS2A6X3_9ACTN|nr:nucleotide pyrophosphatase/phosphodiesterase family protein [Actinoplanes ovalisporus]MBM2615598.1 alkaline phosphatase family protein [Actinoplanes ovalisporus]